MSEASVWWVICGALVALEMLTLSFYLLMLALGAAAGAIAAHMGLPISGQLSVVAVVSAIAVTICYLLRSRPGARPARADRNVILDVGETVQIDLWNPDGTASVRYRGAQWTAVHRPGIPPTPGPHRVTELQGSRLVVEPV